jgi:hypothetical protein
MNSTSRIRVSQGIVSDDYIEIHYGNIIIVVDCDGDPGTDGVRIYANSDLSSKFDLEFRNIPGFVPPAD